MTSKNSNNSAYTPRKSEFEADYYMDNQGFLVKMMLKSMIEKILICLTEMEITI